MRTKVERAQDMPLAQLGVVLCATRYVLEHGGSVVIERDRFIAEFKALADAGISLSCDVQGGIMVVELLELAGSSNTLAN